jgi:ABC-2 type transport system permease protein
MIDTVIRISLLRLLHNRSELTLTFAVPVVFFSIFALIFGSRESGKGVAKLKIAICDELGNTTSRRAIELLDQSGAVRIHPSGATESSSDFASGHTRSQAENLVRRGTVDAAIRLTKRSNADELSQVEIVGDSYDQVSSQILSALVQRAVATTHAESRAANTPSPGVLPASYAGVPGVGANQVDPAHPDVSIQVVDLMGANKANPAIAMYAAGIAVMFLLFSATTASGSLLEERESSTLQRLLASRLTMDQLLMGKWCYLALVGFVQMLLMFAWGQLVFGVDLIGHWDGFLVMTIATVGAASSFALLLAAACQTRQQLNWVAIVSILTMSALGGSMVPRYLMSPRMQSLGLCTFNAWALDGYNKVFWRELPVAELSTELGVLTTAGLVFLVAARCLAFRWERA